MASNEDSEGDDKFLVFRECLSGPMIERLAVTPLKSGKRKSIKGRSITKRPTKEVQEQRVEEPDSAEDLSDFIDASRRSSNGSICSDER